VRWWFVTVTSLVRLTTPGATAAEIPKVCKLKRFESTTPMNNQPTNVNPWSEWDEWLDFPPQEEPYGESETNVGNFASTVQPRSDWELIPEMESKWIAINGASELALLSDR